MKDFTDFRGDDDVDKNFLDICFLIVFAVDDDKLRNACLTLDCKNDFDDDLDIGETNKDDAACLLMSKQENNFVDKKYNLYDLLKTTIFQLKSCEQKVTHEVKVVYSQVS